MPRATLERDGVAFTPNDNERRDLALEASCLSIEWPNYKMFYRYRRNAPEGVQWLVISIAPEVLWEFDCAFCVENAAKGCVTRIPVDERRTAKAFSAMFAEHEGMPTRTECGLPPSFPTNPQAEVLVFDTIPREFIRVVYADPDHVVPEVVLPDGMTLQVSGEYFLPRKDHRMWPSRPRTDEEDGLSG